MTIKPAYKILSLTHKNCWGKPNRWILPPLLQKNKYGRSQLYRDQIFAHTIYLYNRKLDWWLIVDPIWLVWHTYISHWSTHWTTHWTAHHILDAPTKRYSFTKKKTQQIVCSRCQSLVYRFISWLRVYSHQWINKDYLQTRNVKLDVRMVTFSLLCVENIFLALSKRWIRREYYVR